MTKAERLEKQKIRLDEMLCFERELWTAGNSLVAGVDEVGRGPLAGPVVTAAVILPAELCYPQAVLFHDSGSKGPADDAAALRDLLLGVDDSKKLSPKKRDELFDRIKEAAVCWSTGRREPQRIDEINILQATKEAMEDAVNSLSIRPDHVLIDAVKLPRLQIPQTSIIKGDARSVSIAAASIIAKVTRDREMVEMARIWPGYAFESNKGYGTAAHYEGLAALGPCPIHRKTFL